MCFVIFLAVKSFGWEHMSTVCTYVYAYSGEKTEWGLKIQVDFVLDIQIKGYLIRFSCHKVKIFMLLLSLCGGF